MPARSENPLLASGASSGLREGLPVLAIIFNGIGCAYSEEDSGGCACRLEHGLRRLVFLCSNGLVFILVSATVSVYSFRSTRKMGVMCRCGLAAFSCFAVGDVGHMGYSMFISDAF